ncbi:MAG: type II toxin-antitoxin system Phd/YefM family antitoxin [Parazoarcus communis]
MTITAQDIVSLTTARAQLSELAEQVKAGAEKIITKNGEGYVALVDAHRLDYYHRLEQAHLHLLMLNEVQRGLEDVAAGSTRDAREALMERRQARTRA